ncbi:Negative regulator of differentiation 1, partial [Candida tropicalis]
MKSPLNSNHIDENDDDSDNTADYSILSSNAQFPMQPPQPTAFVPIIPYVSGNPLMTHSNPSLVSTHSADPVNYGNRSIYLGNLHPKTTIEEIANNVRAGGLVESINYRPEKRVCFITFVDPNVAYKFYMNHQILHQLVIHGYEIIVGWAKQQSGPLHRDIMLAVTAGASRNVYIGIPSSGCGLVLP